MWISSLTFLSVSLLVFYQISFSSAFSLSFAHKGYRRGIYMQKNFEETFADLKIVTFNILAPPYKRIVSEQIKRESENEEMYASRNSLICDALKDINADVICIQEFWYSCDKLVRIYKEKLCNDLGYTMRCLPRTSVWRQRDDGLAMFVKDSRIVVQDYQEINFHDCGDRVAQLALLALRPDAELANTFPPQQFLCVNTHLLFPHNEYSTNIRLREVTKVLGFVEAYRQTELCSTICGRADVRLPVIIAGDFNGPPKGKVFRLMRSQNYRSSMTEALSVRSQQTHQTHQTEEQSRCDVPETEFNVSWVSHLSHRNKAVPVDQVFFLNPSEQTSERLPPVPDWTNLVFRELRNRLAQRVNATFDASAACAAESVDNGEEGEGNGSGEAESDIAFFRRLFSEFDQNNSSCLSVDEFRADLARIGYANEGEPALTDKEVEALIATADLDGDGRIDYDEFAARLQEADELAATSSTGSDYLSSGDLFARSKWLRDLQTDTPDASSVAVPLSPPKSVPVPAPPKKSQLARQVQRPTASDLAEVLAGAETVSLDLTNARPMGDLRVSSARLLPSILEEGVWPTDFLLSDHGIVVVDFEVPLAGPIPAEEVIDPEPYAQGKPQRPTSWVLRKGKTI